MTLLDIIVKCRKRPHQRIIYRGDIYSRLQTGNRENAQQWESGGQSARPARGGGGGKVPCAPAAPGLAQRFLPERPHPSLWQRPEARTARDTERPQRACRRQHWPPRPNSHFPEKRAALALRPAPSANSFFWVKASENLGSPAEPTAGAQPRLTGAAPGNAAERPRTEASLGLGLQQQWNRVSSSAPLRHASTHV